MSSLGSCYSVEIRAPIVNYPKDLEVIAKMKEELTASQGFKCVGTQTSLVCGKENMLLKIIPSARLPRPERVGLERPELSVIVIADKPQLLIDVVSTIVRILKEYGLGFKIV